MVGSFFSKRFKVAGYVEGSTLHTIVTAVRQPLAIDACGYPIHEAGKVFTQWVSHFREPHTPLLCFTMLKHLLKVFE